MKKMPRLQVVLVFAAALLLCLAASPFQAAATVIYTPTALSSGSTIITFEEFALDTVEPLTYAGATIWSTETSKVYSQGGYTQYPGIFEGQWFGRNTFSSCTYYIEFDQAVAQFGLGVFDPNYAGNKLVVYDAVGNVLESIASITYNPTTGGVFSTYVGFLRDAADIKKVALIAASGDFLGLDNVTYNVNTNAVPLPPSLGLLGMGLVGLGLGHFRRRKS